MEEIGFLLNHRCACIKTTGYPCNIPRGLIGHDYHTQIIYAMLSTEAEETLRQLSAQLSACVNSQDLTSCLNRVMEQMDLRQFYESVNQLSVTEEQYGALHALLFSLVKPDWIFPELYDCLTALSVGNTVADDVSIEKEASVLESVVDKLCQAAQVREFVEKEGYFSQEDFVGVVDRAANCLAASITLLEKLYAISQDCEKFSKVLHHSIGNLRHLLESLSFRALFVCLEHMSDHPWTSTATVCKATKLLILICTVNHCSSFENYMSNQNNAVFPLIFSGLKLRLQPSTWKQNPSVPYVFSFCVHHLRTPFLSDHLGTVLSAPLLFVDDHEVHYKCLGLDIIQHVLNNASKSELRWYGRADVLYDLLSKELYSREPEVLTKAIPCLFAVLEIVGRSPPVPNTVRKHGKCDEMFRTYVRNMSLETMIPLRCIYSHHLPAFIAKLGITVVRHMEELLTVIALYLEVFDGPTELCRLQTLEAVHQLLVQAWPRIPVHCHTIIQSVIRLIYDVSSEESVTPPEVNQKLLDKAVECLQMLRQICPDKVDDVLTKLKSLNLNVTVHRCIDNVLI